MKSIVLLFLCLMLLLSGCDSSIPNDSRVLVSIEEIEGCTIENNGQYVQPGEDAVFTLRLDRGLSLVGTDYPGSIHIDTNREITTVTVSRVRYPTRIRLELSHDYAQITYHSNGGYALHSLDASITKSYSLSLRSRPNTDTGADMFARDGYELLCWNTEADGSGTRIGLGSRITVSGGAAQLYAQWAPWSPGTDFEVAETEKGLTVTAYHGSDSMVVIPETINGLEVTAIAEGAFRDCAAQTVVLSKSIDHVAAGAFQDCALESILLYDNIMSIYDDSFRDCPNLKTLYINAIEAPFGYAYRKESHYADKVDLLIQAQGEEKLVFYGGCSMWYNLDGAMAEHVLGQDYQIINMGLNGTVSSAVQMQILGAFLEPGDVFFHTPELSSRHQMMTEPNMRDTDKSLWSGIENNYDLFALVDLSTIGGIFNSLSSYLDRKDSRTNYQSYFTDDDGQTYLGALGCIPFSRTVAKDELLDNVYMDPARIDETSMQTLARYYYWYQDKGVTVYVSYASINLDAVEKSQLVHVQAVEDTFRAAIEAMDGPVLLGDMQDFLFVKEAFYDTNYHLLSEPARIVTRKWLDLLTAQLQQDGLWKGAAS